MPKLDHFTLAYIEAALWSSNDESTPEGGNPMDANYSIDDISAETLAAIIRDCGKFQEQCGALFVMESLARPSSAGSCSEQAGHDFWLTRNGHGAGFWDGDWEEPAATTLDKASEAFGEFNLYIGDDKKIHHTS